LMVGFPADVERWRALVNQERRDMPADLVLSVIQQESGGKPGAISARRTRYCVKLPSSYLAPAVSGIKACNALGLMQVIPKNIESYNTHITPDDPIAFEDMIGKKDARKQIRVGVWVLRNSLAWLNSYDPKLFPWPKGKLTDDQARLGLCVYAIGPASTKIQLDGLRVSGRPLTFDSLASFAPEWGAPANRPIHYAGTVWDRYTAYAGLPPAVTIKTKTARAGAGAGVVLLALAFLWALSTGGKRRA
jgi:hypothetical protein